jgi:hypothetical protein
MAVSLRSPHLVDSLIAVENAPINAQLTSDFSKYIQGMQAVDAAGVKTSKDAHKILGNYETAVEVKQFLLSNLKKTPVGVYKFRIPLNTLKYALDNVADFPFHPEEARFEKPTLFIRGTRSH